MVYTTDTRLRFKTTQRTQLERADVYYDRLRSIRTDAEDALNAMRGMRMDIAKVVRMLERIKFNCRP